MLILTSLIVLIVLIFLIYIQQPEVSNRDGQDPSVRYKFTTCNCPELATWHPGQVEHKLKCSKFWELNPGRTKDELLLTEFGKHSNL